MPQRDTWGYALFLFWKKVFLWNTYATAMSVITWQNETFRGRGGHLLHCIAKGRSVVGISAFFRHTLIKVRLHISVRLTSVFISAPSFWTFYSAQHQCHVSHSGSLMKSDWFFLVFQTGVDPQPSFGNHLLDFVGANMNPPPPFFWKLSGIFSLSKIRKIPPKIHEGNLWGCFPY